MNAKVIEFIKSKGRTVIQTDKESIDSKLLTWKAWYNGYVDGFHNPSVYNGKQKKERKRKTLNIAAQVCKDWADLLLNEKVELNVDDDHTQEVLNDLLKQVNFKVRCNNLIEAAFALGGGFLIQYYDGKKVNQKYITQDYMYPLSFDSGRLTEAGFASTKTIGGKTYTYLEIHTVNDSGKYVIDNYLLKHEGQDLVEMGEDFYTEHNIALKVETDSETPCFQMIRPNIANRDVFDSPFGTSVFSGATDAFEAVDIVFDSYYSEMVLGKKRIFVREGVTTFRFDENTGEAIPTFDPQDECFYSLPDNSNGSKNEPIVESNMALRVDELDKALQTQLNLVSQLCGFGNNGYKWDNGSVATATQVVSENSKMFRTLKKHEEVLRVALIDMAKGLLCFQKKYFNDERINLDADITVDFDDSIIEDTAEIKRQAMLELNSGLIDAIEYYQTVYHMTEEQATAYYDKIQARKQPIEEEPDVE